MIPWRMDEWREGACRGRSGRGDEGAAVVVDVVKRDVDVR
jgi:hypothetical protein